jgi:hypothetical protein
MDLDGAASPLVEAWMFDTLGNPGILSLERTLRMTRPDESHPRWTDLRRLLSQSR